jgi:hypothetical protein
LVGGALVEGTFGSSKVDDVAIGLEHVHLFNGLYGLNIELRQGSLQLLVVCASALVRLLDLSSRCALATIRTFVSIPFQQIPDITSLHHLVLHIRNCQR